MTSTLLYYRSPWTLANFGEGIAVTMGSNFPKEEEPVAEAWIPAYLDGVSRDFTAEMPGSKAKTELASVRGRGLLGDIAASVPWVLDWITRQLSSARAGSISACQVS